MGTLSTGSLSYSEDIDLDRDEMQRNVAVKTVLRCLLHVINQLLNIILCQPRMHTHSLKCILPNQIKHEMFPANKWYNTSNC